MHSPKNRMQFKFSSSLRTRAKSLKTKLVSKKVKVGLSLVFLILMAVGAYLLAFPYLIQLFYLVDPPSPDDISYQLSEEVAKKLELGDYSNDNKKIPKENRLVMANIGVDAEILEGESLWVLKQKEGVWHEPFTEDPTKPGNMVIAGHRLQYLPPNTNTFYNLDKVKKGDKILIYWKRKEYVYEVFKTFVVKPEQVEIRNNSRVKNELTIYTCTPLDSRADRLVVKAKMI